MYFDQGAHVQQGRPVSYIALLWMLFTIVVLAFPTTPTPTSADMNYSALVFGGVIILSILYYYLPVYGGKYWFKGPRANVDIIGVRDGHTSSGVSVVEEFDKEKGRKE